MVNFEQITDEIAALLCVGVGVALCVFGKEDIGWKLVVFGGGYLFGKANPLQKGGQRGAGT